MSFSIVVNFDGDCRETVNFYAEVFLQNIPTFMTYGESNVEIDSNLEAPFKDRIVSQA